MRGEYCVYGATGLSLISAIMLVFANISQLSSGAITSGLYFAQVDMRGFGGAYDLLAGGADGLWAGNPNAPLGTGQGLRYFYRYGVYGMSLRQRDSSDAYPAGGCGYITTGAVCNATMFGYPFEPLGNIQADITTDRGMRQAAPSLIGADQGFSDSNYNQVISRTANMLIFVGSALTGVALIVGIFKTRITFLTATIASGLSALFLLIGGAMWSAIIARNSPIANRMISETQSVGIKVTAGAALYLVWVAFAFQTLSVAPYVISFLTFRRQAKSGFQ